MFPLNRHSICSLFAKASIALCAVATGFTFTSSSFAGPGSLYVTDLASGSIIVYAPDGTPSTFATGLTSPQGIAFDQSKNLYVADAGDGGFGNGTIFKYDIVTKARTTFRSGLWNPIGLTIDGPDLLIAANGAGGVLRVPLNGDPATIFKIVEHPFSITSHGMPPNDTFFRYITNGDSVFQVAQGGTTIDIDPGDDSRDVSVDGLGNVFVGTGTGNVTEIPADGGAISTFASGFDLPTGMDFRPAKFGGDTDRVGFLYVADTTAGIIYQISQAGVKTTFVTGAGQPNFIAFEVNDPPPVITSPLTANAGVGQPFIYQITATNGPTSFDAIGLPAGLTVDTATGLISGTPTAPGSALVNLSATNSGGTGKAVLTLTVLSNLPPPVINSGLSAMATEGQSFTYQITATNSPTSFDATGLPAGLTVDTATGVISGTPSVTGTSLVNLSATNSGGTGTAVLTLDVNALPTPTPAAKALNISTRVDVGTGDDVAIGGFIITGTESKKVIIRAIGPSLANAVPPVAGALADPILELHEPPDDTVVTNDNWKDTQESEIIATLVPPTDDLESAIVATLDPGAYTAIVRGVGGGTGVGLVEVYDLDDPAATSELANISTRGAVGTDANVLIGGVIIGPVGGPDASVVVRAIGPSLSNVVPPVANALGDPVLQLFNVNGDVIATNDNWQDDPIMAAKITAANIAPTNDNESAIFATLIAGNYTAIVSGAGGSTGVALVEIYHVPTPMTGSPSH